MLKLKSEREKGFDFEKKKMKSVGKLVRGKSK